MSNTADIFAPRAPEPYPTRSVRPLDVALSRDDTSMTNVSSRSIRRTLTKIAAVAALATLFASAAVPASAAPEDATATGAFSLTTVAPDARLDLTVTTTVPADAVDGVTFVLELPEFIMFPFFASDTDCATVIVSASGYLEWTAPPTESGTCTMTLPIVAIASGTTSGFTMLSSPTAAAVTQPPALTSAPIAAPVISTIMSMSAGITAPAMGPQIGLQAFSSYRYELFDATGTPLSQNVTSRAGTTFSGLAPGTTYQAKITALDANGEPVVPLWAGNFPDIGSEVVSAFVTFTTADPAPLKAAVAELADDINSLRLTREQMTESSWAGLVYALDDGRRDMVLDSTQARYDEVLLAITNARLAIVDNTALRAAYASAQTVDLSSDSYTDGTRTPFTEARNNAASSLSSPLPQSATLIAELTSTLEAAQDILAVIPTALSDLRFEAFQGRYGMYSQHSIAQLVTADDAVTQHLTDEPNPDLDWAETTLRDAIAQLVDVSSLHTAAGNLRGVTSLELTAASAKTVTDELAAVEAMLVSTDPITASDVAAAASAANAVSAFDALVLLQPLSARLDIIDTYLTEVQFTPTSWQRLQAALVEPRAQLALWSTDVTATATTQDIAEAAAIVGTWHRNLVHVGEVGVWVLKGGEFVSAGDTITAGDTLTIMTRALEPGSSFRIELHSTPVELGRITVAADGSATMNVTVPLDVTGAHTLRFFGIERGATAATETSFAVTIAEAPIGVVVAAKLSNALAVTGGSLASVSPALALLTLGAALLAFARGRRGIRTQ
jgi:hypothetical protein